MLQIATWRCQVGRFGTLRRHLTVRWTWFFVSSALGIADLAVISVMHTPLLLAAHAGYRSGRGYRRRPLGAVQLRPWTAQVVTQTMTNPGFVPFAVCQADQRRLDRIKKFRMPLNVNSPCTGGRANLENAVMVEPYLTELRELVAVADCLRRYDISCRHFFRGAAAYCDENIFMTLTPIGLAIKLSVEDRAAAFAAALAAFCFVCVEPASSDPMDNCDLPSDRGRAAGPLPTFAPVADCSHKS